MKRTADRQAYREVAQLGNLGLCNACRFARFYGSECSDGYLECDHPLEVINGYCDDERPDIVWSGDVDCWGFRPRHSLQEFAVWVGIILEGNIPHVNSKGETVALIPSKADRIMEGIR